MITTIIKLGNSQGITLDSAWMDLANLKVGDQMSLELHVDGTITLTPLQSPRRRAEISRVIEKTMSDYAGTMKKLA